MSKTKNGSGRIYSDAVGGEIRIACYQWRSFLLHIHGNFCCAVFESSLLIGGPHRKLLWLLNESLLRIRCVDSGALRDHQAKIFKALEATEAPEGGKSWFRVASSLNRIGNRKFGEQFAKLRVALPTFPKARHCVVNVLVVGPPNIGKSSLVMLGCFGKFISNHDVDLDV